MTTRSLTLAVVAAPALLTLLVPAAAAQDGTSTGRPGMTAVATYYPPPDSAGGWRRLTDPAEVRRVTGFDVAKLDTAFAFVAETTKNGGLLVLRDGWLVYARYFGKGHPEAMANLASIGKSFTSVAVGRLTAERPDLFPDPSLRRRVFTPAYMPPEVFPVPDPRREEIQLGHLLTFTACIRGNSPAFVRGEPVQLDPVGPDGWQATLDAVAAGREDVEIEGDTASTRTLWCEPGGGYSYATSSIHLASMMLRHITGMELEEYVRSRFAKPLGWGRWGWGYRGQVRLSHTPGGGGIVVRPTDMLRFGYLLLNEGWWGERELVPAEFVRHARRQSLYNPHYPYSLQFNVNTRGGVPDLPRDAFWKSGSGGHALYVVPSLGLVVWKLGGRDGQYSPEDTGIEVHPGAAAAAAADPREGWRPNGVPAEEALHRTLKLVIEAIDSL